MNHDPLCKHRSGPMPLNGCPSCDEISDIRANEREKAAQRVQALMPERVVTGGGVAYCDALREALAAVRGES